MVVMPANGLRVNHYDFVALHSMWIIFSKGFMCLSTSGNYTQVEILTGNSSIRFSGRNHTGVGSIPASLDISIPLAPEKGPTTCIFFRCIEINSTEMRKNLHPKRT